MATIKDNPSQKASPFPKKVSVPLAFGAAIGLRIGLLLYGSYQDAHSSLKYTDIDYLVFTDAARFVSQGRSPYVRATYRYTPLLAWILLPTARPGAHWFSFGKALFAASDVVAGYLILAVLKRRGLGEKSALTHACVWLLNPMVANISTRGSSEGLLCVMVMGLLWAIEMHYVGLAGVLLGLSVHFKIYPFIYGVSILWALESKSPAGPPNNTSLIRIASSFFNVDRRTFLVTSLSTFSFLTLAMYVLYGLPFLQHTYLHHLTRIDHRHNFSPYNTLLYLSSAAAASPATSTPNLPVKPESLAFIPQLLLSTLLIPLALAKKSLPGTLLAQTFAFVSFNKVCTSQYFLWYLIFLPVYLPESVIFSENPRLGIAALTAWVAGQALWLGQGYQLEFLGRSAFVPGLWLAGLAFFAINVWILGMFVEDVGKMGKKGRVMPKKASGQTT